MGERAGAATMKWSRGDFGFEWPLAIPFPLHGIVRDSGLSALPSRFGWRSR